MRASRQVLELVSRMRALWRRIEPGTDDVVLMTQISAVLAEAAHVLEEEAVDAAKWRALRNSARVSTMGSAGLGIIPKPDNYAHLTLNFWTAHEAPSDQLALQWLDRYVEIAQRAQLAQTRGNG